MMVVLLLLVMVVVMAMVVMVVMMMMMVVMVMMVVFMMLMMMAMMMSAHLIRDGRRNMSGSALPPLLHLDLSHTSMLQDRDRLGHSPPCPNCRPRRLPPASACLAECARCGDTRARCLGTPRKRGVC